MKLFLCVLELILVKLRTEFAFMKLSDFCFCLLFKSSFRGDNYRTPKFSEILMFVSQKTPNDTVAPESLIVIVLLANNWHNEDQKAWLYSLWYTIYICDATILFGFFGRLTNIRISGDLGSLLFVLLFSVLHVQPQRFMLFRKYEKKC